MGKRGGKREGAGRKPTLKNEIITALRDRITNDDFDTAVETLRYAMAQRAKNIRTAVAAAQFIVDQKAGRAPQSVDLTTNKESLNRIQNFDPSKLPLDTVVELSKLLKSVESLQVAGD